MTITRCLASASLLLFAAPLAGCDDVAQAIEDNLELQTEVHTVAIDVTDGTYTSRATPPGSPLILQPIVLPSGEIGFFGPGDGSDVALRDNVLIYDPVADAWRDGATWPNPRYHADWVPLGDAICSGSGELEGQVNVLDCYDSTTDTWSVKATPTVWARHLVALDGKIYAFDNAEEDTQSTRNAAVYDPDADAWQPIADKPACKVSEAVAFEGKIYAFGCAPSARGMTVYDPATDTWTDPVDIGTEIPIEDVRKNAFVIGGEVFIDRGDLVVVSFGDESGARVSPNEDNSFIQSVTAVDGQLVFVDLDSQLLFYDPSDQSWRSGDALPVLDLPGNSIAHASGETIAFGIKLLGASL